MHFFANKQGGHYWRYSDDLVLVLPTASTTPELATSYVAQQNEQYGSQLKIKSAKICIGAFTRLSDGSLGYKHVLGDSGKDGIQYLGFRLNGRHDYLLNSTLSNFFPLQRKRVDSVRLRRLRPITVLHASRKTEGRAFGTELEAFRKHTGNTIRYISVISQRDAAERDAFEYDLED